MNTLSPSLFKKFFQKRLGIVSASFFLLFVICGVFAPLFASSKPAVVIYHGQIYFPLFRYLFYSGYFSQPIDLFFNLLMFTLPCVILFLSIFPKKWRFILLLSLTVQLLFFLALNSFPIKDPSEEGKRSLEKLKIARRDAPYREDPLLAQLPHFESWQSELELMNVYAKINHLLYLKLIKRQHRNIEHYGSLNSEIPTLWNLENKKKNNELRSLREYFSNNEEKFAALQKEYEEAKILYKPISKKNLIASLGTTDLKENSLLSQKGSPQFFRSNQKELELAKKLAHLKNELHVFEKQKAKFSFIQEKTAWEEAELQNIKILFPPLLSFFHWEEDSGGGQKLNQHLPWWHLTRLNRKDLLSSLIFGTRISLMVGSLVVFIAAFIGISIGSAAAYWGGKLDLFLSRVLEVWEGMPILFILLLFQAIVQVRSMVSIILLLGFFGWTSFARFTRAEVLKQKNLTYVLAAKSQGFSSIRILLSQILPNALPPVLTLIPFVFMSAVLSEASLSFLGLGTDSNSSWGTLLAEARSVFPAESFLLWPPACILTIFLISIALMGDAFRDAADPRV